MPRRLPVYILLDCSESMAGGPLDAVEAGVYTMISALNKNPYAIETVHLSVITFDAKARVEVPLTEVTLVKPPTLSLRPGTCLGAALDLARERISSEVAKTTAEAKGDYKPQIFILTDGQPTDEWRGPAARLRSVRPHLATIYAIGCGDDVDFETLAQIADVCIHNKSLSTESLGKLFVWLSASVQSQSVAPDKPVTLEKVPLGDGMELVDPQRPPKFGGESKILYFHVTCRKTRKPYMMRYRYSAANRVYFCQDAVKLPDDFFSDGAMKTPPVDSDLLAGGVDCPYCGGDGWGKCGFCGHLFCLDLGERLNQLTCPVCETTLTLSESDSSFSVDGSQG
jgi:uncharacterized protein YegL